MAAANGNMRVVRKMHKHGRPETDSPQSGKELRTEKSCFSNCVLVEAVVEAQFFFFFIVFLKPQNRFRLKPYY